MHTSEHDMRFSPQISLAGFKPSLTENQLSPSVRTEPPAAQLAPPSGALPRVQASGFKNPSGAASAAGVLHLLTCELSDEPPLMISCSLPMLQSCCVKDASLLALQHAEL